MSAMADISFAQRIIHELNSREWNQARLAQKAGVSRTAIGDVLSGRRQPGVKLLKGIAQAFNIPLPEVLSWVDETATKAPDYMDAQILNETKDMSEQEKRSLLAFIRSTKQMRAPEPERGSMPASNLSKAKK